MQRTTRDIARTAFVESLYTNLKKQTASAIADHEKNINKARAYVSDGLDYDECVELLTIDGLNKDAAISYLAMVEANTTPVENDGRHEYCFQFEDIYGKLYSSYEIGKIVKASNEEEAWIQAESLMDGDEDFEGIISINRIS
jgi:hypothetical protein